MVTGGHPVKLASNLELAPGTIFTARDDGLLGDASRDGLGLLAIWRSCAQAVFRNYLTQRTGDLRLFSIALFHHNLVRQHVATVPFGHTTPPSRVQALIMRLEAMLTLYFAFSDQPEADSGGIPGVSKVRGLDTAHKPLLGQDGEILAGQRAAGIDGRHRGPFIEMGFFDYNGNYFDGPWRTVESTFREPGTPVAKLGHALSGLLTELERTTSLLPFINDQLNSKSLRNLYLQAWGTRRLPEHLRGFWRSRLGFGSDNPQAQAVYQALRKRISYPEDNFSPRAVFLEASASIEDAARRHELERILAIAPFLTVADWVIRRVCHTNTRTLEADLKQVLKFGIAAPDAVPDGGRRLTQIKTIFAQRDNPFALLERLRIYHRELMDARGSGEWFQLDRHQVIPISNVGTGDPPSIDDLAALDKGEKRAEWAHDYYAYTVGWLCRSIEAPDRAP